MIPITAGLEKRIRYPGFFTLLVIWTLVGTVSFARYVIEVRSGNHPIGETLVQFVEWLTCFYPWLFLTPLLFRIESRFPLMSAQWQKGLAVLAAISLPVSWLAYAGTILLDVCARFAFRQSPLMTDSPWRMPLGEVMLQQAIYWPTVGGCCIIRKLVELREKEQLAARLAAEKSEIEASLRRSELELLRMRLNPHFLFNSLQNISVLARQNPDAASLMLARLGEVLRAALRKDAQAQTTLSVEIELTKAYVAVEEIRFAGGLSVQYEIGPRTERAMVPSFLLQPLVENAMTHGLKGPRNSGAIWIRSMLEDERLMITVSDNGSGLPAERLANLELGIGLGSTCERLERMYPGRHSFSMRKLPEGGTEARIVLPLEWESPSQEVQAHELASIADRR